VVTACVKGGVECGAHLDELIISEAVAVHILLVITLAVVVFEDIAR
jgi:hypothetical protein